MNALLARTIAFGVPTMVFAIGYVGASALVIGSGVDPLFAWTMGVCFGIAGNLVVDAASEKLESWMPTGLATIDGGGNE